MNFSHARASFDSSRKSTFQYCRSACASTHAKSSCCRLMPFARMVSISSHIAGFLRSFEIPPCNDSLGHSRDLG
jgi:hypothetical protein